MARDLYVRTSNIRIHFRTQSNADLHEPIQERNLIENSLNVKLVAGG